MSDLLRNLSLPSATPYISIPEVSIPKMPEIDYEGIRKGIEERSGYANVMFKRLLEEIEIFESELNLDEEIGAYIASSAGGIHIHIESITYRDPYYIVLSGTTEQGSKARLVQHVTQTSILFVPVKIAKEENREARRFGFNVENIES